MADLSKKTDKQLNKMLFKNSGYDAQTVRAAVAEMERRGLNPPPASLVTGGREYEHPKAPPKKPKRSAPPKKKMNKGGMANCGASMRPTQSSTKKMAEGGMLKKADNPGLKKLPTKVRNNMGYMMKGGYAKKK